MFRRIARKRLHNRKVLLRQAGSFLLLILLLLFLFFFSSRSFHKVLREEIRHTNKLFLDIAGNEINEKMKSLENAFSFVCSNDRFRNIFWGEKNDITFHRKAYELDLMLQYYRESDGIDSLIYVPDWDYIIAAGTANELHPLYKRQNMNGIVSDEEEWRAMLSQRKTGFFFSDQYSLNSADTLLIYSKPLSIKEKSILVYLSLPLSDLDDMFSHSDSFLFITDKDGTVLYTFGASQNIPDWQSIPVDGQAVFSGKEGTYVLTSRMANHNDWQFIIATPETIYWASSTYVQRLLAFAIILAALMGLLMTVLLLRYNYRPVNNLMRLLNEHGNGRDEYEVILSAFRNIQAENQSYEKNSHLQQKKMREQYLLSRLKGKKYMLQDQDFNSYYAIETTGYTWCLIALSASLLDEGEYAPEPFLEKELASFALDNVFSELIEDYPHYHMEDGNQLFYLLYLDETNLTRWEQNSDRIFSFLGDFFKKYGNAVLTGVVSDYVDDFSCIDTLYLDVVRVLEHRWAMDEIGIVYAKSYHQQRWLFENESWFVSLKTAVSQGDEKSAMALADSEFSRFREGSLDFSILKIQVNECMYHILVVFQQIVTDYAAQQQLVDHVLSIAIDTESGAALYEKFVNALHYACSVVQRTLCALNNTLISQIDAYVEENYNDMNLNVATIAEHFGKHPNYISKIYFSETGIMLLNRIHKARIDRAKELLRQGGLTIAQIAEQTGFGNTRTFRRVFAKETGLTPSEYQRK